VIIMANEKNLKKGKGFDTRTTEEQREIARKGGIASGEARREKRLIKDRILERMGESDWDAMIDGLIGRAIESDKAFEVLRDTIGQKPIEKMVQTNIDAEYLESVEYINKLFGED
jgi:general stress protein YciG